MGNYRFALVLVALLILSALPAAAETISDSLRDGETKEFVVDNVTYEITAVFIELSGDSHAKLDVNGVLSPLLYQDDYLPLGNGVFLVVTGFDVHAGRENRVYFTILVPSSSPAGGGGGGVPEFSTATWLLAIASAMIGITALRRR